MPLGSWYSQLPPFGWFDPEDRPGSAAYRVGGRSIPDSQQGIALPTRGGLGKWYNVTPPGSDRPMPFQQTDIGPAPWTGRGVDVSAAAAHQMGYTPKNFPTDANFKVEPIDLTGLGLAAGWGGGVPGDNQTAVAEGPRAGARKMPDTLMDMFQPRSAVDNSPIGFADGIAQNRNSLIGLGMGLLQPRSLAVGAPTGSAWSDALGGYAQGARADSANAARQAALAHQKTQDARQAAMDRFNMGLREREFAQSQLTPYQKMEADIARAKGTPQEQQVTDFYRSQLDAGPPQTREIFDLAVGRNVIQEWDSRSKQYKTATQGGSTTAAAPADPFTTPAAGKVYGHGGDFSRPAPAATGAQGQPVQPPKKPLTAHEQTQIDEADKALQANRSVIGNLQDAQRLSKTALAGWQAGNRAVIGANLPDVFPGASNQPAKDALMLHNITVNNAVEQLRAAFGGNPTEGERKVLIDLQGAVDAPRDVREEIYKRAERLAHERLAYNEKRAQQIRGGTYYQPGGGATGGAARPSGTVRRYNPETGNIE